MTTPSDWCRLVKSYLMCSKGDGNDQQARENIYRLLTVVDGFMLTSGFFVSIFELSISGEAYEVEERYGQFGAAFWFGWAFYGRITSTHQKQIPITEAYITEHTDAVFSHGACPDCYKIEMEKIGKKA